MDVFVLDTNLFFNMEAGLGLGEKTEEVVVNLTATITKLKKEKKAQFLIPPRIADEFLSFFDDKKQEFIENFLSAVNIESPDISKLDFPAAVFYKIVEDIRARSYRGLTVAEEEIIAAARKFMGKSIDDKKEFQIQTGAYIKNFRNRYRNATRTGFLDSLADLDLITLSKQKGGFLVSTDQGVLNWGRTFGVKEMPSSVFRKRLEDLLAL